MQTLIAADNHWALLAILFASTFLAIFLEQKYQWASKISGAIITLVIAIALVNPGVIPSDRRAVPRNRRSADAAHAAPGRSFPPACQGAGRSAG